MRRGRHLLMLALCIATLAALAQQSIPASTRQDSIGTARQADAFLRAKDYRAGYDSQIIPALQMLSRSSAHRDSMPLYCAWALDYYAWGMLDSGWLDIAKQLFDKAIVYCPANDSATYYAIQSGLAYIDLRKGRRDVARRTLEKVTDYHRRVNDLDFLAKDLSSMGSYHTLTDNQAEALRMYRKALDICQVSEDNELKCLVLLRIGNTFGSFAQRDSMLREALNIEFDKNLLTLYSPTYQQLGRLYLDNGRTRDALLMAQEALDNAVRYNQTDSRIQSLRLLSDIYAALGEWQLANSNSKEALILVTNQKNQMDADISAASLKAQTLVRWCEDNVVVTPNGFTITEEKEHRLAVYAWLIATAIVVASLIFLLSAMMRRKVAARLVDRATEEKVGKLQQANDVLTIKTIDQAARIADMAKAIHYLRLFYSNFNPFMGKLRGMVMKATGKDDSANATVRNIGTFISLNMLPAYSTDLDREVCDEEEAFLGRLIKQYPELSDNEKQLCVYLRMGLSTQEICVLTGNQPRSVNMARYRLRRALDLAETDNLEAVISRI